MKTLKSHQSKRHWAYAAPLNRCGLCRLLRCAGRAAAAILPRASCFAYTAAPMGTESAAALCDGRPARATAVGKS
jgi:hypothetical protein